VKRSLQWRRREVNLTNQLVESLNELVHRKDAILFHQQNCAHLYMYTQIKVTPNFYTVPSTPGVSNSVSYAGHILTKKGSRAALRGKMSPRATIGG